jgi:hypothetical protein
MLTVCPKFFLHKWETKQGKVQLIIEIPEAINEILEHEPVPDLEEGAEEIAYHTTLNDDQL